MMDVIAITGATSTLGVALINECIRLNKKVIAFVNPGSNNEKRIPESNNIIKVYCSLSQIKEVDIGELKADAMIHLAWGFTNSAVRNLVMPQVENIKYCVEAVELAEKLGCKVFVGAGSQAEYGIKNIIIDEETSINPVTAYGMAKYSAELLTREECRLKGIRYVWPRIFSTYGPNTQDSTIINYTIRSLMHGESPCLTKCEQMWDFLFVDDAAKALLLLAEKGVDGEVYCIASGECRKLKEYIDIIAKQMSMDIPIEYGKVPYNDNAIMHLEANITKVKKLGFNPSVSFDEGIRRTIDWAKEYYTL